MKKTFFISFAILLTNFAIAQTPPQPNSNISNPSLDKFIGTWMWVGGTDTLKIVLKKENILLPFLDNVKADFIIGFHLFKQGNNIVENSLNYTNTNCADNHFTISATNSVGFDNPNEIGGSIKNIAKNKLGGLTLLMNAAQNQLVWAVKNREGVKNGPYDFGFSYPLSLTLQKQ